MTTHRDLATSAAMERGFTDAQFAELVNKIDDVRTEVGKGVSVILAAIVLAVIVLATSGCTTPRGGTACVNASLRWLAVNHNLPKAGMCWYYRHGIERAENWHSVVWYEQDGARTYIEPQLNAHVVLSKEELATVKDTYWR